MNKDAIIRNAILVISAGLMLVGQDSEPVALAVLPGLALLLVFARSARSLLGFIGVTLAYTTAWDIAYAPALPVPFPWRLIISGGVGLSVVLVVLADRLTVRRLHWLLASLVLPAGLAGLELVMGRFSPGGSGGSLAYAFADHVASSQIVSLTGWTGLTFLAGWLATLGLAAWECRGRARVAAATLTVLVPALVWAAGAIRVSMTESTETFPVASVIGPDTYSVDGQRDPVVMAYLRRESENAAASAFIRGRIEKNLHLLERALAGGAAVALLPEANPVVRAPELAFALGAASDT